MPKKRNRVPFHKPQSSVHPSISRTSQQNRNHGSPHQDKHDDTSVNDLLQHLRVSQAPSPTSPGISTGSRPDVNPQTVHPSLIDLLQIPETPPLRPRPGSQISRMQARRRPPGPAAPKSWLESGSGRAGSSRQIGRDGMRQQHQRPSPDRPDGTTTATTLPDLHTPPPRSLQHQVFKSIARNWEWHLQHDQYYLATLMVRHKQILISYVAWYSPHGIDLPSLEAIFLDDESLCEGATGAEGLTHLDLPTAAGRSLTIHDLKHLLTHKRTTTKSLEKSNNASAASSAIPDSWDATDCDTTLSLTQSLPTSTSILTTLTHLSLPHPSPNISWRHLLLLTPHLRTLTHLSLAHWPLPSLTPNSTTAFLSHPTITGSTVDYGDHNFYSHTLDSDFSGAAFVLRRLCRDTYCLRWLDLTGCQGWLAALAWGKGGSSGVEWEGGWGGVERVVVAQGFLPPALQEEGSKWREVLEYHGWEHPRVMQAWKLREWVVRECEAERVLQRIRDGGVERDRASSSRDWDGDDNGVTRDDDVWRDRTAAVVPSLAAADKARKKRTGKLVFEHGWKGWWIEDCIRFCKER